jgi:hypothetical protein
MTKETLSPALQSLFDHIVPYAERGERCPTNEELLYAGYPPYKGRNLAALAHAGWVKIAVYTKNWRTVTILKGEHEGAHTELPPLIKGKLPKPYRVIDGSGDNMSTGRKNPPQVKLADPPPWEGEDLP